ncbi:unnamed protein product [Malus baccata var. baccata]
MANLAKLDFVALDITGKNYLTWVVDAKICLEMKLCGKIFTEEDMLEKTFNTFHASNVSKHNLGPSFKNANHHKGKAHMNNIPRNLKGVFHRCGGNGHWAHNYLTLKHLMDLYQASLREKGVETNILDQAKPMDIHDPVFDLPRHIAISNDNLYKACSQGKLIMKLQAQFPDYPIKSIRLDNTGEFMSQTLDDYCMTLDIDVEHHVPHVYTQNGLA